MKNKIKLYQILGILGIALIIATYFMPVWWVALQSRQYPKSMYPSGIRIDFRFSGVYNGCEGVREREELAMNEGAECLVEMIAINHFIGMYAITQGRNRDKDLEFPGYYVFDTKKNEAGEEILNTETGKPIAIDVTPFFLKFLDQLMINSPYLFVLFVLLALYFIFTPKKLNAVFAIIPSLVPFYFLIMYMIGLYWYGHNLGLHGGGAFEGINDFMPTVFGEGKVAQFTTVSYPYFGFLAASLAFASLLLAMLFKKKELKKQNVDIS